MSATHSERAKLEQLTRTPYIRVLTYPRVSLRSARARVRQLERLGVSELVFQGRAKVGRLGILGIGTVGVVVTAVTGKGEFALKIRRLDANREDVAAEVRLTKIANRIGVGPEVYASSGDFILMRLLHFEELEDWLRNRKGKGTRDAVRTLVHATLNQCRKLDIMGLDHGQLSNLRKHLVIAEGVPWIIDFESAGTARRPKNVTSAAQFLFVGGSVSPIIRRILGLRGPAGAIEALTMYKRDQTDYRYAKLLERLKLVP